MIAIIFMVLIAIIGLSAITDDTLKRLEDQ